MTPKLKIAVFVFLTLRATIATGQYVDPTYDSDIKSILSDKVDTVIRLTLPIPFHPQRMNIRGIGNVIYQSIDYIFYRKCNKVLSQKTIDCYPNDDENLTHFTSKSIEINDDSIINFVYKHFNSLYDEEIYPFMMKVQDTKTNQLFYKQKFNLNPTLFEISIYMKADSWRREINQDSFLISSRQGTNEVFNLNYQYNICTHIYQLFNILKTQIEKLDTTYSY